MSYKRRDLDLHHGVGKMREGFSCPENEGVDLFVIYVQPFSRYQPARLSRNHVLPPLF